ncbi:Quinolinate synthase A, partial [Dissostichus eleginoides]
AAGRLVGFEGVCRSASFHRPARPPCQFQQSAGWQGRYGDSVVPCSAATCSFTGRHAPGCEEPPE